MTGAGTWWCTTLTVVGGGGSAQQSQHRHGMQQQQQGRHEMLQPILIYFSQFSPIHRLRRRRVALVLRMWIATGGWVPGVRAWRRRWVRVASGRRRRLLDHYRRVVDVDCLWRLLLLPARVGAQAGHQATSTQRQAARVTTHVTVPAVERQTQSHHVRF